jgi:long-chain fatty acid transport protein
MSKLIWCIFCFLLFPVSALASGFGVFTQNAAALGQANAVVAHSTGPSSLYFNPALLNDVPGRQMEIGATGIYADRKVRLDSGGSEEVKSDWNFPSTFYYTHQANETVTAGLGVFFPFGLSTEWGDDYEGRYLGTSGDVFTLNLNPVISVRVSDRFSLAAGLNVLYLDATLESKVNQTAAYIIADAQSGDLLPDLPGLLNDIGQKFEGDGWGAGYNVGALFKATDRISIGATYRSHIDVDVEGEVKFSGVNPLLTGLFPDTGGDADIRLPAQATAGVAVQVVNPLIIEIGVRWEDWESTEELRIEFDSPVFGQPEKVIPRDWKSTWTYNLGGRYQINEAIALNAGYLYGQNAVPGSTFEPLIPDTDAHLFTIGSELRCGAWTISGAFGLEHHEDRGKKNELGDDLASALTGQPEGTANGEYQADIYLLALSAGYRF